MAVSVCMRENNDLWSVFSISTNKPICTTEYVSLAYCSLYFQCQGARRTTDDMPNHEESEVVIEVIQEEAS